VSARVIRLLPVVVAMLLATMPARTQSREDASDLTGTYQALSKGETIPGGLKNAGSPEEVPLRASAAAEAKKRDLRMDPAKLCQTIGPFRMMASDDVKFELLPWDGRITMLFENASLGNMRTIYFGRPHKPDFEANWQGDAIGRWDGDTLVIDTLGFNDMTWLNAAGAPHTQRLHLVERVRPLNGGQYLEYKVTADDPQTLTKPYRYTRYFKKASSDIQEYVCVETLAPGLLKR
jgi:hypothetical protein